MTGDGLREVTDPGSIFVESHRGIRPVARFRPPPRAARAPLLEVQAL